MSEEEKIIEKHVLKRQLLYIPIKAVIAFLIAKSFGSPVEFDFLPEFLNFVIDIVVIYSLCSVVAYFSKAVGNWLIGIILFVACIFGISALNLPAILDTIGGVVLCFGAAALDISRIIKLILLSYGRKSAEQNRGDGIAASETAVK